MFREMRRKKQQLTMKECEQILRKATAGVLALSGDEGYPYAVPISYVWDGNRLLFHSAANGHKIDAVKRCAKASFCVIDQDEVVEAEYTTYFRSVIVFGTIRILEEDSEKRLAIEALAQRYSPNESREHMEQSIRSSWTQLCMLELVPEHMTGKEAIELVRKKEKEQGFEA